MFINRKKSFINLALLSLTLSTTSLALSAQPDAQQVRPATVIYKVSPDATASDLKGFNALLKSQGLVSERTLDGSQIVIATFDHAGREKAVANIIKKSGYVTFAEPDYSLPPILQPNDPAYSNQWHHNTINSQQAWDMTTGSHNVLVGVCDTGFDVNHPDLSDNLRTDLAYNAHDGSDYIFDANGHGTGTAGTLGAVGNNGTGVAGVNWDVDIIPIRIAISDSNSSAYISTMAACIEYAADNGARVVNLSYGGIQYATIDSAAQYLRSKNGLLFMSAGNDGQEFASYPDYTSFVGVGATDQSDNRASFSSWGTYVDITAPGVSIRTTYPDNRYVNYSGTSFSSPVAAGVAALMVSANPGISVEEIENGIFSTTTDLGATGDDNVYGHGLINAQAAVEYAMNIGSFIAPVAQISTSSDSVPYGESVSLSAVNSYDSDGSIVAYQWQLGDGTFSSLPELTHVYTEAGNYQVSLTVTDNDGLTSSASTNITVTNDIPVAVISNMPTSYNAGEIVYFNGSSSYDNDGNITDYSWEFGNGDMANGEAVEYTYTAAGNYSAILTVTDNAGAMSSAEVAISVTDPFSLNAPGNLSAQVEGLIVTLSWTDQSANESNFVVERGVKYRGKVSFEAVATLSADATAYTDSVPESGQYEYRVKAVNSSNEATSESIMVKVDSAGAGPAPGTMNPPSDLQAQQNGNIVNLSWTDNSSDELGFYLERGEKVKGKVTFTQIAVLSQGITSYPDDISALASGNYAYRVRAYKDGETSEYSNTVELRIK
ncbi:S8 family serine peptidase [Lacimicrobium sp. SS2-24]|uniref:S8 family serine peptidase n=1 Tax=Lacimicrobium sp. SS2-24 TaxID=2005569 RepID=UPI000B4BE4A3|nr:S8 family serine peptidase [Lacimicrobium sp. SS2-24]